MRLIAVFDPKTRIYRGAEYIVAPPSFRDDVPVPGKEDEFTTGSYCWKRPLVPLAELPVLPDSWIENFLPHRQRKPAAPQSPPGPPGGRSILPSGTYNNIDRCRAYLDKVDPCVAGQGGDNQLFKAACVIFWDFGLSESDGVPLLNEFNARCLPPWPPSRLTYKMNEALKPENHAKPRGHLLEEERQKDYGVDLSNFSLLPQPSPKRILAPEPEPISSDMLWIPGYVGNVIDFTMHNAPYPNLPLAFCGAMALQSYLASRKVCEPGGLRPNLYLLALGISGGGKAYPRKVNAHILRQIGHENALGNQIASGAGLEDAMFLNRKMIFQTDEIDNMMHAISSSNDPNYMALLAMILQIYSEADEAHSMRVKAGNAPRGCIDQPGLVILGNATPDGFFDSMSVKLLTNGLFSRSIIIDVNNRGRRCPSRDVSTMPKEFIDIARWWSEFNPAPVNPETGNKPNLNDTNPTLYLVPVDTDGETIMNAFGNLADDEYDAAAKSGDPVRAAVWTRAYENAMRMALVYACSKNHLAPVIDRDATLWASNFETHVVRRMLFLARKGVAENPFHRDCLKMKKALRSVPLRTLAHRDAMQAMKNLNKKTFRDMMETLVEQGAVAVVPDGLPVGARGCSYQLIE